MIAWARSNLRSDRETSSPLPGLTVDQRKVDAATVVAYHGPMDSGLEVYGTPAVTDDLLMLRVLAVLAEYRRPVKGSEIRSIVRGQAIRLDVAVRKLLAAGLLRKVGRYGFVVDRQRARSILEALESKAVEHD